MEAELKAARATHRELMHTINQLTTQVEVLTKQLEIAHTEQDRLARLLVNPPHRERSNFSVEEAARLAAYLKSR